MSAHMEVYKGGSEGSPQRWYWRHRAGNNRITAVGGEGYLTKWGATRAAKKAFPGLEVHAVSL